MIGDPRRQHDELGKSAGAPIVAARDSQHLTVVAQVHLATAAECALAAINGGVERDAVAYLNILYSGPHALYHACRLMAHHDRWNPAPGGPVVAVDVAPANAAGRNLYQEFIGTRHRNWKICDLEFLVLGKK